MLGVSQRRSMGEGPGICRPPLGDLSWLLISLFLVLYGKTYEGQMRKLSDISRIQLVKGGRGAPLANPTLRP